MTQKTWSTVEISAYLDGALDNKTHAAFEAALGHDEILRHKVDALRATVDFVQSVPMRESPRNYLLTPAMVKQPRPVSIQQQRPMMIWMRLATSLSAIAFVVMFGLNLLTTNSASKLALQSAHDVAPEMVSTTANAPMLANWEESGTAENAAPVMAPSVPEERAINGDSSPGYAGDAVVGEAASMAPTATMQPPPQAAVDQESFKSMEAEATVAEAGAPSGGNLAISDTVSLTHEVFSPTPMPLTDVPSATPEVVVNPVVETPSKQWVTAILGVLTLILAFVTFKMSRRP